MCQTTILPTIIREKDANSETTQLIFVLNRWLKMLNRYGRLDMGIYRADFKLIEKVLAGDKLSKTSKRNLRLCRDCALGAYEKVEHLKRTLSLALKTICKEEEDPNVERVKKLHGDQGLKELYSPLNRRLKREYIYQLGKCLVYADVELENSKAARLVRRIVEKRAAQTVHKHTKGYMKDSNKFRQNVRRAKSFTLYYYIQNDSDSIRRESASHWKRSIDPYTGETILRKKRSYASYEEAYAACLDWDETHPNDTRPVNPYKCEHCSKWHIGHDRVLAV